MTLENSKTKSKWVDFGGLYPTDREFWVMHPELDALDLIRGVDDEGFPVDNKWVATQDDYVRGDSSGVGSTPEKAIRDLEINVLGRYYTLYEGEEVPEGMSFFKAE